MTTKTASMQKVDARDRRIETDFRILDTEQRDKHDRTDEWATLRVITWHDKARRAYVSRVRRMMTNARGGYRTSFDLMSTEQDPAPVEIDPTARYNAERMREVHDAYLSQHLGGEAQFDAAIAWARKAVEE